MFHGDGNFPARLRILAQPCSGIEDYERPFHDHVPSSCGSITRSSSLRIIADARKQSRCVIGCVAAITERLLRVRIWTGNAIISFQLRIHWIDRSLCFEARYSLCSVFFEKEFQACKFATSDQIVCYVSYSQNCIFRYIYFYFLSFSVNFLFILFHQFFFSFISLYILFAINSSTPNSSLVHPIWL